MPRRIKYFIWYVVGLPLILLSGFIQGDMRPEELMDFDLMVILAILYHVAWALFLYFLFLRLRRRAATWIVQKNLRTGNEKTRWGRRIFYAVVLFGSLCALILPGFRTLIPARGSLIIGVIRLLRKPILIISGILFLWLVGVILALIPADGFTRLTMSVLARRSVRGDPSHLPRYE